MYSLYFEDVMLQDGTSPKPLAALHTTVSRVPIVDGCAVLAPGEIQSSNGPLGNQIEAHSKASHMVVRIPLSRIVYMADL